MRRLIADEETDFFEVHRFLVGAAISVAGYLLILLFSG